MCFFLLDLEELCSGRYHDRNRVFTSAFANPKIVLSRSVCWNRYGINSVKCTVLAIPGADKPESLSSNHPCSTRLKKAIVIPGKESFRVFSNPSDKLIGGKPNSRLYDILPQILMIPRKVKTAALNMIC